MRRHKSKQACRGLADQIEEALRRKPSTIQELCRDLGFSYYAIHVRLMALMTSGRVHYVKTPTNGGVGLAHVWHPGPASKEQLDELQRKDQARAVVPDRGPICTPQQVTTRAYTAVNRRDPLVAALFGPARQAAA
ncbi:hypothetical protein [Massilia aerilata]|uniref:LexA repressor DNA-binding domain-containing protein n=1 Tax=Massilia aerilata TaxID=453817 RepID=A0ABW0S119_9BURK